MTGLNASVLSKTAPSPPSDVNMSQNGLNSVLVTWTPSQGPDVTGYTITYQENNGHQRGSITAGKSDTFVNIGQLIAGATYSIYIVVTSNTLPSITTTAKQITLGTYYYLSVPLNYQSIQLLFTACLLLLLKVNGLYLLKSQMNPFPVEKQCPVSSYPYL